MEIFPTNKINKKMNSLHLVHLITGKNIKNGVNRFYVGFMQKFCNYKLNDTNGFQG